MQQKPLALNLAQAVLGCTGPVSCTQPDLMSSNGGNRMSDRVCIIVTDKVKSDGCRIRYEEANEGCLIFAE